MSANDPHLPAATAAATDEPTDTPREEEGSALDIERFLSDVEGCLEILEAIAADHSLLSHVAPEDRMRLVIAAGKVSRPDRARRRALRRAHARQDRKARREADAAILDSTGIRSRRRTSVFETPSPDHTSETPSRRSLTGRGREPHRPAPISAPLLGPTGVMPTGLAAELVRIEAASSGAQLNEPRNCYVCKCDFYDLHSFYDQMCASCADFNWLKRVQTADLRGRTALITGGRVKIGYQATIKLLRAGARVIMTTRFPRDGATRFAKEEDFEQWRDRLEIHGLDLRHSPSVEAFTREIQERHDRLDFILNNACQTVRRPPSFYAHMMEREHTELQALPPAEQALLEPYTISCERRGSAPSQAPLAALARGDSRMPGLDHAAALSQLELLPEDALAGGSLFPEGALDADLQQVDLRDKNSWRLRLDEVSGVELLEVHLVNAVAPFLLNARLKPLMVRSPERGKHIVNVSAMEGQFYRTFKTDKHPHTNMAKAALNMMTRTSAPDYARDGIHMNSVDTGWITDEDPAEITERKREEHGFHPPLDIVDAAARICDPIFSGINTGTHVWGQFLKDYRPTDW